MTAEESGKYEGEDVIIPLRVLLGLLTGAHN
jgi:hypothetical protein